MHEPEWSSFYQKDNVWTGFIECPSLIEVANKPFSKFPWYFTYKDKDYNEIKSEITYGFNISNEALYHVYSYPIGACYAELRQLGDGFGEPRLIIDLELI